MARFAPRHRFIRVPVVVIEGLNTPASQPKTPPMIAPIQKVPNTAATKPNMSAHKRARDVAYFTFE